jgi:pre-mRNA-splicing factor CWC26
LVKAAAAPFARYAGDAELEAELKKRSRDGDPMATQLVSATTATGKPRYTGPPGPANRYGIPPGFRWDGIDRSNGWEQRLIAQRNGMQAKKEREYQFRVEDM